MDFKSYLIIQKTKYKIPTKSPILFVLSLNCLGLYMLRFAGEPSETTEFVERTELTNPISCFNIRIKKPSLRFATHVPCVCLIFNFGHPLNIQFGKNAKVIAANQYNLVEIAKEDLCINPLSYNTELFLHIITLPLAYFRSLGDFLAIGSGGIKTDHPFALKKSREISNEMHYNLQTLRKDHTTAAEKKVHVHGKLLTMLAMLMRLEDDEQIAGGTGSPKATSAASLRMNHVEQLIREDWNNTYSIKELAKIAGTNECYLKRDFKAMFGMPINAYRLARKMEYAKTLLIHTKESIKSISKKLGYKYTTHFNAAYKRHHHMTPGETRNSVASELLSSKKGIFPEQSNHKKLLNARTEKIG